MSDIRIGYGIDIHQFQVGRPLILGGCHIASEKGLMGHSDADVLLHSITDAILGALALGDIGSWFPDTDPEYKNADSKVLLSTVWNKVHSIDGWNLVNLDCTVILEKPKLRFYIDQMRESVAGILDADISRVSIKATTSEKLGFVGREEGISAQAVVLISRD
ncbi:MAG TPA: 2-C-methyl-D-erythritol 2,4-cyclodiphosphate synthase [Oligoflexia bacterium]|nr:2-C-methyl-D-erythritol 2,4-cyclodiphosphate synthase [Oligoflexia bacterium]HMP47882.1 2-C-methyl-D-erythritol 2,4-cyclodiphosphate synthase [Oligoflexia bacterium]